VSYFFDWTICKDDIEMKSWQEIETMVLSGTGE